MNLSRERLTEIWRYYQAGLINTAFGFGTYSLLVWLGLNLFAAQLIAHVAGMGFNYITYSRHVFRDAAPARLRFILSYAGNYGLGLAMLYLCSRFIDSPYLAGFTSILIVSAINYFMLKYLVFRGKTA
ncbi:GtrA family protein [Sphingobium sp. BYY-5]|uniref:GtrA family protein n=1 Tax=Sphingobium sp. BYY-5 TaxID=2926400 RepID=UPI001FA7DF6D|nr:GtrA family protein [Sphingobium sp. BYY-5]MCI4590453.1 GtrA family protein [Sphingobium sp. BYY-5]